MGTWIGRYAIVEGEVQEHGPWLAEQLRVHDEERVRLLVLADPVDERSAQFCAEVAAAVADLFAQESLSLTGGLLRALRQAHRNLAEWNQRSLHEHRVAVGVTCVAVRDGEATVAQVGPGLVYLAGPDGVRRVTTEGVPAARPLGGDEPVEPQFLSIALAETQILLLNRSAESAAGPPAIGQALSSGTERALADLFLRTRQVRDLTAVLVAELPDFDDDEAAPVEFELPNVTTPSTDVYRPSDAEPAPAFASTADLPPGGPLPRGRSMPELRRLRVAGNAPGPPWRLLSALLVAGAALFVLTVALAPSLLGGDAEGRLEQKLAAANNLLAAATLTNELADQRESLQSALEEIEEARSIDAQDPRVSPLQAIVQQRLDELNAVTEVLGLRRILQFEGSLTAPLTPAALVAGGGWLWLLDSERGRVFVVDPAGRGDPVEAYRAGLSYGGSEAADPLAIAWDDRAGRLLLLDEERTLFSLAPGSSPAVLPLRDADELSSVDAIATYEGNLYVLDSESGEVWRYLPAGAGFDSERAGLLGGVPLDGAQTLAVDGDLFLLVEETVRRFSLGRELDPLLQGIDRPLNAPVGVAEDVARGLLYVADRGGRRVVVGNRDGDFLRQYVHPGFLDLRGLALAPDGATVFVLSGDGIDAFDAAPEATAGRP